MIKKQMRIFGLLAGLITMWVAACSPMPVQTPFVVMPAQLKTTASPVPLVTATPVRPGLDERYPELKDISSTNVSSITQLERLPGSSFADLAWLPDGSGLVIGTSRRITLLDRNSLQERWVGEPQKNIASVASSPDGQWLGSGDIDGAVTFWDVQTGEEAPLDPLEENPGSAWTAAFSPDGRQMAATTDLGAVLLWNVKTGEVNMLHAGFAPGTAHSGVYTVAFSPDGAVLASGNWDGVTLWNVGAAEIQRILFWQSGYVYSLAFSPVGSLLAEGHSELFVHVWNWETGQLLYTLEGHTSAVMAVAFSPDGKLLASGSKDGIRLWDMETGTQLRALTGHTDVISKLAFSPDGKILASGSWDGSVILWGVP